MFALLIVVWTCNHVCRDFIKILNRWQRLINLGRIVNLDICSFKEKSEEMLKAAVFHDTFKRFSFPTCIHSF